MIQKSGNAEGLYKKIEVTLKRLIIVGAGAVGGSIGGLLTESGSPNALVARGAHGTEIRNNGLSVRLPSRTAHVRPTVFERIDQVDWRDGDVAMLATKLQDAQQAMDDIVATAGNSLPVVCANNGIHAERWARDRFENVVSMLVWVPATFLKAGQVSLYSSGSFGVLDCGPVCGSRAAVVSETLCRWLQQAGFDAVRRDDIQAWKYAKWITNLGGAAQALVSDDWRSVASAAQAEGELILDRADVARVATVDLLKRCEVVQAVEIDGQKRQGGSTWQSRQRGKTLESPWIEGAIADLADEIGIPAPVNRYLSNAARSGASLRAEEVLGQKKAE